MKLSFLSLIFFFLSFANAWPNEIYSPAPGFTVPAGDIAYLGSFYGSSKIWQTGSKKTFLQAPLTEIPSADKAVSEVQAALLKNAKKWDLTVEAVPAAAADQGALLLHVFRPDQPGKYPFSAERLSALSGGKPYALVGIIDYYGTFGCPVKIRENMDGKMIDYFRRQSILERDDATFTRGYNKVGAFELFLISTRDGSLLWQANGCDSFQHQIFNSFWDAANHEMEQFLKNLAGKK